MKTKDKKTTAKFCKKLRIVKKTCFFLPVLAALSAALSCFLERSGLRARIGLGGLSYSHIAFFAGWLLFFVILMLAAGAGRREFDSTDASGRLLYALVVLMLVTICLPALKNTGESIKYPMTNNQVWGSQPYIQQFDAFQKGQIELDLPVSERLAEMENPYDKEERERRRVDYYWDRAYYNGKYYSYFGIAPIICLYYPHFALTKTLPSTSATCLYFSIFTIIFLALALREFIIFVGAKPKLWLALLALVAVAFGSGLYAALSYSDVYYIPVLSAMGFNFAVFFFVFLAHRAKNSLSASALLAFAALSFVFSVMSRPTAALMCVAAAPAVIDRIFFKTKSTRAKLLTLAPAALVALSGAAFVMTFNYLRFGSPLDFGANYQLTVCDISQNTLTLRLFPAAIIHYVLQRPEFIQAFPFVKPSYLSLEYRRYMYLDYNVGMAYFPATMGFVIGPLLARFKSREWARYSTFIAGAAAILLVVFVDLCKAGVNMRYLFDFLPLSVTLGSLLFLRAAGKSRHALSRLFISIIASLAFVATILTSLGIVFANGADRLFS